MIGKKNFIFKNIQLPKGGQNLIILISDINIGGKAKPSHDIKKFHDFLQNLIDSETKGATKNSTAITIILMGTIINPKLDQQLPILNALLQCISHFHAPFYVLNSPNAEYFESIEYLNKKKFNVIYDEDYLIIEQPENSGQNKINLYISYDFKASGRLDAGSLSDEVNDVKNAKEIRKSVIPNESDKNTQNWIVLGVLKSSFVVKESLLMSVGHCFLEDCESSYGIIKFGNEFMMETRCVKDVF